MSSELPLPPCNTMRSHQLQLWGFAVHHCLNPHSSIAGQRQLADILAGAAVGLLLLVDQHIVPAICCLVERLHASTGWTLTQTMCAGLLV